MHAHGAACITLCRIAKNILLKYIKNYINIYTTLYFVCIFAATKNDRHMNTTIITADKATQKEVLARCTAASTYARPVCCFNDADENTIISGVPTEEAQRILDGLTYGILKSL